MWINIPYMDPGKSKDQTLPRGSGESFTWIILKTSHFVWSTGLPGWMGWYGLWWLFSFFSVCSLTNQLSNQQRNNETQNRKKQSKASQNAAKQVKTKQNKAHNHNNKKKQNNTLPQKRYPRIYVMVEGHFPQTIP